MMHANPQIARESLPPLTNTVLVIDHFPCRPPRSTEAPQQAQSQSRLLDTQQETQPPSLHRPFNLPERQSNPLEIGRSDLDPFPNPFAGKSPIQPLNLGGGMYVGPGHPMFGGHPAQPGGVGGGRGGVLPPLGAPSGARFDPIVPFGAGGIGVFPGRDEPPRGGPFTGEPDNDEFLPPRFGEVKVKVEVEDHRSPTTCTCKDCN
ncbi:hypothetical protein FRB91_011431 [Serendipita sp. 411]|nr:hypothetical protein FRC18_007715 [Serendipita sp. 400]KAG8847771.1 hypothetical protein FRB91_011431 [Serendipita sp. 411]